MANKKITVVGEGFEQPLTPDEEHWLEVKVDAMMDPATPTPQPPAAQPEPAAKKITIQQHDEAEVPAAKASKPKTAVTKKAAKKVKVTISDNSEEELAEAITVSVLTAEEPETPAVEAETLTVPEVETIVESIAEPDAEDVHETTADTSGGAPPLIRKHEAAPLGAAPEALPLTEPVVAAPASASKAVKIIIDEPETEAEEITVEVEPPIEPAASPQPANSTPPAAEGEKKYQPPEGPMQFKRAEVPIQPLKPGEPRPASVAADELSEDEALAQAFEAPVPNAKPKHTAPKLSLGKLAKILVVLVVLAILAAAGVLAAKPTLRHRALHKVGLYNPTSSQKASSATTTPAITSAPVTATAPDIYIAQRDAIYNLYQASATGQPQLVLGGTGNETSDIAMAPNAASTLAALVATRDGKKDNAGNLQQSLTLVSVPEGKTTVVDSADHIKLVDWFGSKLVYVLLNTSIGTNDANRYQIISYDTVSKTRLVLDHANYLNDVLSAQGTVYYATAAGASNTAQFASIKPDGSAKQVVLSSEVAAITRTSYNDATLSTVNKWYSYHLGSAQAMATNNVTLGKSRRYVDSPNSQASAYLSSDTQLTILNVGTGKETNLSVSNASYPLRWLSNDTLVYRSGAADYQIKTTGGTPLKLTDVADVPGISLWHEQ